MIDKTMHITYYESLSFQIMSILLRNSNNKCCFAALVFNITCQISTLVQAARAVT